MIYIVISVLMIIIGLVGILKTKLPKYRDSPGFAAEIRLYFTFYVLLFAGTFYLVIRICR